MPKLIYGLIGHPVGHSLSPAMHSAGFKELGLDAEYRLFDVKPEELETFLGSLAKNGVCGINVTIPHKITAKEYIGKNGALNDNAKKLGAVNTIAVGPDGKLTGYNTDGAGFYRSLVEDLRCEPEGTAVAVLGAGGAARAVVMYLGRGPKNIIVTDTDAAAAAGLKNQFEKYYGPGPLETLDRGAFEKRLGGCDILVQATPVGMKDGDPLPVDVKYLHPKLKIYDLVYNRPETRLVAEARKMKINAVTGLGMLLYQGVIAFELWTQKKAPVEVMRRALKKAIESQ
jgi:shikimate dehydrogenase